ncbi:hypothetical protein B0T20DRAFT_391136 [Sordaria brevicollis]|uniref:Uncharacterized protein n=1 Tax=Sordaria brevicollis TaxID=83679 RepID=A0AAE0PGX2_SORBR|nr:hypothetical protein B0T20DRAFT_391136 [Sordaria brevicollis]
MAMGSSSNIRYPQDPDSGDNLNAHGRKRVGLQPLNKSTTGTETSIWMNDFRPGTSNQKTTDTTYLRYILGLLSYSKGLGTHTFRGDFPITYAFLIFGYTGDYFRLLQDDVIARRLGNLIQAHWFNMKWLWKENHSFITGVGGKKFLRFLIRFRQALTGTHPVSVRDGTPAIQECLSNMISAIRDELGNEDGSEYTIFLDSNFIPAPENSVSKFHEGMLMMRTYITTWWRFTPAPFGLHGTKVLPLVEDPMRFKWTYGGNDIINPEPDRPRITHWPVDEDPAEEDMPIGPPQYTST